MFKDTLRELVEAVDGGLASTVMDSSGIALESYVRGEGGGEAGFDISTVGIEFGVVLSSIQRASEQLGAGAAQEVVIETEKHSTLLRVINETYYMAFTIEPTANIGKARFRVRLAVPQIIADL